MARIDAAPDHYVLLCAHQFATTAKKLRLAATDKERQHCRYLLHHIQKSGVLEAECERRRRERHLPSDIRKTLAENDSPPLERAISEAEAELVRYACSVPPVATLVSLSSDDLVSLADLFEGWAQDRRLDALMMVKLLGWTDGFRTLVSAVGADHLPPERGVGERDLLLRFIATTMRAG